MWRRGAARADGRASDISVLQIRRAWRRPFRQPAIAGSNPGQADTILTSGACGTPDRHTGSLAWTHAKRPCPVPQHLLGCGRRQTLLRMQYGSIAVRIYRCSSAEVSPFDYRHANNPEPWVPLHTGSGGPAPVFLFTFGGSPDVARTLVVCLCVPEQAARGQLSGLDVSDAIGSSSPSDYERFRFGALGADLTYLLQPTWMEGTCFQYPPTDPASMSTGLEPVASLPTPASPRAGPICSYGDGDGRYRIV